MSYKDITTGKKTAKPIAMRLVKSKKGTEAFEVMFEFMEPSTGAMERLAWQGWITEASIERTMDKLVHVLGYSGSKEVDAKSIFTDPLVLNFSKEVELDVNRETNPEDGKEYPKIAWVNSIGGSGYAGMSVDTVKSTLNSPLIQAAFLKAKQSGKQQVKNHAPVFDSKESIPF